MSEQPLRPRADEFRVLRLYNRSDLRAQGLLDKSIGSKTLVLVFGSIVCIATYQGARYLLSLPVAQRRPLVAALSVAAVLLLLANSLTVGRSSGTTGEAHDRFISTMPLREAMVRALRLLVVATRGLAFSVFFLLPALVAGVVATSPGWRSAMAGVTMITLPFVPAAFASRVIDRVGPAVPGILIVAASMLVVLCRAAPDLLARVPFAVQDVLATPGQLVLGDSGPEEFGSYLLIWALFAAALKAGSPQGPTGRTVLGRLAFEAVSRSPLRWKATARLWAGSYARLSVGVLLSLAGLGFLDGRFDLAAGTASTPGLPAAPGVSAVPGLLAPPGPVAAHSGLATSHTWALYLAAIGPAVLSTVWLVRTIYPNPAQLVSLWQFPLSRSQIHATYAAAAAAATSLGMVAFAVGILLRPDPPGGSAWAVACGVVGWLGSAVVVAVILLRGERDKPRFRLILLAGAYLIVRASAVIALAAALPAGLALGSGAAADLVAADLFLLKGARRDR